MTSKRLRVTISTALLLLLLLIQPSSSASSPSKNHQQLHNKKPDPLVQKPAAAQESPWHRLNNPIIKHTSAPNAALKSFTITTPPATDIWRPAPGAKADNFTAPYVYRICNSASFVRAAVTVSADWQTRYDQGGIAIVFPNAKAGKKEGAGVRGSQWVKTGVEVENGKPQLGTVTTYTFSDWSLSPVVPAVRGLGKVEARFEVERNGTELWVYNVVKKGRYPLREITWAFLEERGKKHAEIWVGVYAAKPNYVEGKPDQKLTVEFKDLRIEC